MVPPLEAPRATDGGPGSSTEEVAASPRQGWGAFKGPSDATIPSLRGAGWQPCPAPRSHLPLSSQFPRPVPAPSSQPHHARPSPGSARSPERRSRPAAAAHQPVLLEQEDAGGLIEGSGREAAAAAAPGHGVHLGAVRRELAAARVGAEQLLHGLHVGRQRHARPAAPTPAAPPRRPDAASAAAARHGPARPAEGARGGDVGRRRPHQRFGLGGRPLPSAAPRGESAAGPGPPRSGTKRRGSALSSGFCRAERRPPAPSRPSKPRGPDPPAGGGTEGGGVAGHPLAAIPRQLVPGNGGTRRAAAPRGSPRAGIGAGLRAALPRTGRKTRLK